MTSFDLEDVDLGSPNLHHKEFLCGPTNPPSFVFLAFLGAEIKWGAEYAPSPGSVILRPSPGDVLNKVHLIVEDINNKTSKDESKQKQQQMNW